MRGKLKRKLKKKNNMKIKPKFFKGFSSTSTTSDQYLFLYFSTNVKKKKRFSNQQFAFDDGFIYPKENPDLVFEASGVELDKISNFVEIILSKRSFSNPGTSTVNSIYRFVYRRRYL